MATGDEKIEKAIGTINGSNQDFTTSLPYSAGTLRSWLNGLLGEEAVDLSETSPALGQFQTTTAPQSSGFADILLVRYIES